MSTSLSDLDLEYSKYQLYRRVERLENEGLIDPDRGDRNKYLFSNHDVSVLNSLAEKEKGGASVRSAITEIKNERLREENEELQEKTRRLENEIQARNNIIKRLRGTIFVKFRNGAQKIVDFFK